ncbi:hypothetical protein JNB_04655 [Janibacter sp. HTCC2649]|uniref:hypothetical protein n=1 Tax=Janibacter sp. HTCC2649 TaxID=313589 RepID=UPI000066EB76|nr:hypothetical protein [Janibacter sp. HTCC2649]EAP99433.1 hypothetical protein JNB_04655 [Janibacter sp. HTCC2649]
MAGKPGRPKQFDHVVEVAITSEQLAHVDRVATMTAHPRAAVIRAFIQDRLDIAEGRYSAYPESLPEEHKNTLRKAGH